MDQKLEVEAFADSVLKSNIDEEHDFAWFKEHGVYDHPRDVDEAYLWANGDAGRVPMYFDFMLEAKEKVEAKVAEVYAAKENPTVQDILDHLMTIREYAEAPEGQRPAIWVGEPDSYAG